MTTETLTGSETGAIGSPFRRARPQVLELHGSPGEQRLEERLVARELRRDQGVGPLHRREVGRGQDGAASAAAAERTAAAGGAAALQLRLCLLYGLCRLLQGFLRLDERLLRGGRRGSGGEADGALGAVSVDRRACAAAPAAAEAGGRRAQVGHPDDQLVLDVAALIVRGLAVADELHAVELEGLLTARVHGERHVIAVLERPGCPFAVTVTEEFRVVR